MSFCAFSTAQSKLVLVSALAERGATDLADVEPAVRRIVNDVRRNGDRAVRRYAMRWDGLGKGDPLRVPEDELHQAWEKNPIPRCKTRSSRLRAISVAMRSGRRPQLQTNGRREIQPGVLGRPVVRPLESVGCYVPGGRYPCRLRADDGDSRAGR